jgi:NitT/TauT family transport system substrate-binding protein
LIDRSAGADVIMANRSLEQLRHSTEPITVYLEMGSLNEDFFKAFVHENKLQDLPTSMRNWLNTLFVSLVFIRWALWLD